MRSFCDKMPGGGGQTNGIFTFEAIFSIMRDIEPEISVSKYR
jgi:hypothetical protein